MDAKETAAVIFGECHTTFGGSAFKVPCDILCESPLTFGAVPQGGCSAAVCVTVRPSRSFNAGTDYGDSDGESYFGNDSPTGVQVRGVKVRWLWLVQ